MAEGALVRRLYVRSLAGTQPAILLGLQVLPTATTAPKRSKPSKLGKIVAKK
jgi:hypothetical protein